MLKELAAYLRAWKSYFGFRQTPFLLQTLDQWIRRRLRSMNRRTRSRIYGGVAGADG
jgi:hypothetical protein